MKLVYQEIPPLTRNDALLEFESADCDGKIQAILAISMFEPDWRWAQEFCLYILANNDEDLQRVAAIGLGHIARINEKIDKEKVLPVLKALLQNPKLAGVAENALDDIDMFVGE